MDRPLYGLVFVSLADSLGQRAGVCLVRHHPTVFQEGCSNLFPKWALLVQDT